MAAYGGVNCQIYGPTKPEFDGDAGDGGPRRRKVKNRILHLTELMPDASFQLVAQYGTNDQPMYVMEMEVCDQVFQGIGPSKKRAKAMCADYVLVHLGAIDTVDETPADMIDYTDKSDDYTADIADQSTQLFYDFSLPEPEQPADLAMPDDFYADDDDDDDFMNEIDDMTLQLLGKNPLTIMGELRPDAVYVLLDETGDPLHPKFLMSVTLDEETYQGSGPSKKLAKGRAARDALLRFYNLDFGTSENGMPIYEGDARIWQHFKAKLEDKAQQRLDMTRDPVVVLQELFPQIRYLFREPVERDGSMQYTTVVNIFDESYEGSGSSKKESKAAAATNTLKALRKNGVIAAKEREVEADRRAAVNLPRIPSLLECDKKNVPAQRNAVAKLNLLYTNLEYDLLAEKPVRNTLLTAFVMAVTVEGRSFAGVGKTKKAAKVEAAEKALRYLKMWTKEDEVAKEQTLAEDVDPVASISRHKEFHEAKKARMMHGNWGPGPEGNFWGGPEMGWRPNMGEWNENPMGWNEGPGDDWGGMPWDNRGGKPPNFMGGGGGNFNDGPEMGRGFGGGMRPPFGGQGRGMGPRGFDGGFGPKMGGGGGGMGPRGGNFYPDEGFPGDGQQFRNPGFSGNRGGFGPADFPAKSGRGGGGPRMPVGGSAPPKRFPNSTSFDGGTGGFQGNQSANTRQAGPDPRSGGYRSQVEPSGGFRQGSVRPPAKTPAKSSSISNNDPRTLGGSNTFPPGNQQSAPTFQTGIGADGYQYGATGSTGAYKGAEVSGVYQTSFGAGRMYGASEGYQPPGDTGTASFQQPAPNPQQPGTGANYQTSAYQTTTTTAASSMYSGAAFQANAGASFSDPNFMAGYYGGYAGTVGSMQGYGYEYMAGYQMPTGTTADPNYNMAAYSAQNSGYYPGYDYTQANAAAAAAATMGSYSNTSVAGSGTAKTTW